MNIHLVNAVYISEEGLQYHMKKFMIKGSSLRYIHLPEAVSITIAVFLIITKRTKIKMY